MLLDSEDGPLCVLDPQVAIDGALAQTACLCFGLLQDSTATSRGCFGTVECISACKHLGPRFCEKP
ncbi:hypothetical protein EYF80_017642 [Liparis tanakae]|uniref:Uncharacterized protein n=1 Tax=Liparis tanakae TaxID=230148 RepID=A0A4Z2I3L8_9TELE|nr:hypothetical protein EYF80_017642 [Liparis tanakae]